MNVSRVVFGALFFALLPASSWGQVLPTRQAVEVFRIGGIDAPEYAAFVGEPGLDIVAAPDGTIFVRSTQPPSITVFDAMGEYLRTIGGEGEGPGEFRVAIGHGLLGDTLWVIDVAFRRASSFLPDGTHIQTWRLDPVDIGMEVGLPNLITGFLEGPYAITVPFSGPTGGRNRLPVLVGSRDLHQSQKVLGGSRAPLEVVRPSGMYVKGFGSFARSPFPIPPLVSVAGNGKGFVSADWTTEGAWLDVTRYSPSGQVAWTRRLPSARPPVPVEVGDSIISEALALAEPYLQRARNQGTLPSGSFRDLVAEALSVPTHLLPASKILLGQDGSVWIRPGSFGNPVAWMVLDAEGEPRFLVDLPASFTVREATLERVWGTEVDEWDVPYVIRFDIR